MRGYVLAGGQSSRMGMDKAEVNFNGRPMLDIAAAAMAQVCDDVVIVGSRDRVPAGCACIRDTHPGCGPMGGMEAALLDCQVHGASWAVFLPVDVPLLPGGLLRALTQFWRASDDARVAVAMADRRMQPLVSMIHVDVLATLDMALRRGDHKLQPALRAAAQTLAEHLLVPTESVFLTTNLRFGDRVVLTSDGSELFWLPTETEWKCKEFWFANLNAPGDLQDAIIRMRNTA